MKIILKIHLKPKYLQMFHLFNKNYLKVVSKLLIESTHFIPQLLMI